MSTRIYFSEEQTNRIRDFIVEHFPEEVAALAPVEFSLPLFDIVFKLLKRVKEEKTNDTEYSNQTSKEDLEAMGRTRKEAGGTAYHLSFSKEQAVKLTELLMRLFPEEVATQPDKSLVEVVTPILEAAAKYGQDPIKPERPLDGWERVAYDGLLLRRDGLLWATVCKTPSSSPYIHYSGTVGKTENEDDLPIHHFHTKHEQQAVDICTRLLESHQLREPLDLKLTSLAKKEDE